MKRPSIGQSLALKAAAAARSYDDDGPTPRDKTDEIPATSGDPEEKSTRQIEDEAAEAATAAHDRAVARAQHEERWSEEPPVEDEDLAGEHDLGDGRVAGLPAPAPKRGRPPGRREVKARQTVNLDGRRHAALTRLAEARGTSVHALILEGIDMVTGKPATPLWD